MIIGSVGTAIVIEIDRWPGPYIPSFDVGCRRKAHACHVSAAITLSFYADVCAANNSLLVALTVRDSFSPPSLAS
jgi:hypothetical protein